MIDEPEHPSRASSKDEAGRRLLAALVTETRDRGAETCSGPVVFDLRLLAEAAKALHGYLLFRFLAKYLRLLVDNMGRLLNRGQVGPDARPTPDTDYSTGFDFDALDLEKITYVIGFY